VSYLSYHAPRFQFVLALVEKYLPPDTTRVLDVGPSPLTDLLRSRLPVPVETLGLETAASSGIHHHADLNSPEVLPPGLQDSSYGLIVFAEVLEHLHVSPALVLRALRRLLREGGVLVLQTPNAASLPKRLKLLSGRNPYELIREDRSNPGHYREYTLAEIFHYAGGSELEVLSFFRRFYFDARFAHHDGPEARPQPVLGTVKNAVYRMLPPFLREGLTVVLRKRG